MYCKKCGKFNHNYTTFCMYCGGDLVEEPPKKPTKTEPTKIEPEKREGFYSGPAWQQPQQSKQPQGAQEQFKTDKKSMFCKKCGKYNPSYNKVCMYCGGELEEKEPEKKEGFYNNPAWQQPQQQGQSKRDIGVILALFLGIIGLIIGLLLYESGSYERETFISGWVKCFVICIIISVVLSCFAFCGTCALIRRYY